jgi:hypothetical protein
VGYFSEGARLQQGRFNFGRFVHPLPAGSAGLMDFDFLEIFIVTLT